MKHNWYAHEHKLKFMNEMFFVWIVKTQENRCKGSLLRWVINNVNFLEKINKCWKSLSLMKHIWFAHEHKVKVMNEMFFVWIEKTQESHWKGSLLERMIGYIKFLEDINKCWKSSSPMKHNRYAHEHKLKIMNEMFFAWIEKTQESVVERVLYLDEWSMT